MALTNSSLGQIPHLSYIRRLSCGYYSLSSMRSHRPYGVYMNALRNSYKDLYKYHIYIIYDFVLVVT